MRKEQREIYQVLANEVDFPLCSFCKYAEGYGSCCDGDLECRHPLLEKSFAFEEESERAMNLGDCWGFRPSHPIPFCADIIGILLIKGWTSASWWQDKEGVWKVAGFDV